MSTNDPTPPAAGTAKLVHTPPSLAEKKAALKAINYTIAQLRKIPQIDAAFSLPLVEYAATLLLNMLPASHPVEAVAELCLKVFQMLYPDRHDPALILHVVEYLLEKGIVARAPLMSQASHAIGSFMKHALA